MRLNVRRSKGMNRLPENRSQSGGFNDDRHFHRSDLLLKSDRGILLMDCHRPRSLNPLDEELTSAVLAQGRDLAEIVKEVDEITKRVNTGSPDKQILNEALLRTKQCAIKQSILEKELRSLALTDDLTGLYNRRAFYALAGQQFKVARRNGQGLLLFFADVDYLKNINDCFGHRAGDIALARTAIVLERTFRDSDILARLSGDEFAVLALEASSRDEDAIFHRLKQHLQQASADESRYKLSLSVGVARFDPKQAVSLRDLMAKADRKMYEQKKGTPKNTMSSP
jgi:diguanylate cyclase (GGDEF)-like protein